ncbi:unnamed protein product, partial [Phaeothamnion confervicola]
ARREARGPVSLVAAAAAAAAAYGGVRDWLPRYGTDPATGGSKRTARIARRAFAQMLRTPGSRIVSSFGVVDAVRYPAAPCLSARPAEAAIKAATVVAGATAGRETAARAIAPSTATTASSSMAKPSSPSSSSSFFGVSLQLSPSSLPHPPLREAT